MWNQTPSPPKATYGLRNFPSQLGLTFLAWLCLTSRQYHPFYAFAARIDHVSASCPRLSMRAYWFSQWNTQPVPVDVLQFHPVSMVSIFRGFLLRVARIRSIDRGFSQVSGWTSGLDVNKSLEGVKYPISLHITKLPIANEQTMRILDFQRWIPLSASHCPSSNVDTITKI